MELCRVRSLICNPPLHLYAHAKVRKYSISRRGGRGNVNRVREFLPDNRHQLAIYGRIIKRIKIQRSLIQSERLDCRLINCSGNEQAVITLKIGKGRSRLYVKRTGYWAAVVARLLQCHLNVRDDLIRQEITVSVNRSVVIVIIIERIVAPGRIPIASIQEIISTAYENDVGAMLPPPVAIVPFVPMRTQRIPVAEPIVSALFIPRRRALHRFTLSKIPGESLSIVISWVGLSVDRFQALWHLAPRETAGD